ncbi:MAG TPA: hypothetical protein DDZ88_03315 [Verrucomicrobiales bacterium]|nr:hypothetical protein [Verrucomicrobiales bacterium]
MPDDDLKQAAQLHRRWRGIGPILFAIFYSLFFAAHLKLEKTVVYLKDDVVFAANTAAFFYRPDFGTGAGGCAWLRAGERLLAVASSSGAGAGCGMAAVL